MVIQKKILLRYRINIKNYMTYGFLAIILVMLPFIWFFWQVSPEAMLPQNLILFFSIVILSVIANLFSLYALKREDVSEFESIKLTQPLIVILLAFIFSFFFLAYETEGNPMILLLALIASLALIGAHIEKKHLNFNKYNIAALIGSFFFALELVLSKPILAFYHPFTFYFIRCIFIFIIVFALFHPKIKPIRTKTRFMLLGVSIIWVVYRMIMYFGYINLGIVFTTMIFILAPIFIYAFAKIFLKEKITIRQIISSVIIIACVIAAILLKI